MWCARWSCPSLMTSTRTPINRSAMFGKETGQERRRKSRARVENETKFWFFLGALNNCFSEEPHQNTVFRPQTSLLYAFLSWQKVYTFLLVVSNPHYCITKTLNIFSDQFTNLVNRLCDFNRLKMRQKSVQPCQFLVFPYCNNYGFTVFLNCVVLPNSFSRIFSLHHKTDAVAFVWAPILDQKLWASLISRSISFD